MPAKNCLIVSAHPLPTSFGAHLSEKTIEYAKNLEFDVRHLDLYGQKFAAALRPDERVSYYAEEFDRSHVSDEIDALQEAEILVLVFPTWWYGFPAILKGWFDRVWAPGVAYQHAKDHGPLIPCLKNIKHVIAITTLGSPWWIDWLILHRPVRRVLKTAILGGSAPQAHLQFLSLYKAEDIADKTRQKFLARINRALQKTA